MPAPSSRGTCFGFSVDSSIALAGLRGGLGSPTLEVLSTTSAPPTPAGSPVAEWREVRDAEPYGRLYREGGGYWLWINRSGWTRVEEHLPRITLPASRTPIVSEELLWTIPICLCLLHRGDLTIHAAAVEVDGRALLFAAAGGSGKSTLAAAFAQAGYRLLSEDLTCVRAGTPPAVIPGPAVLRLRPDVLAQVALPGARVVRQISSRVTFALDRPARGGCAPVPVHAVYVLDDTADDIGGTAVPPAEAIPRLWPLAFKLAAGEGTATCFAQLGDLVSAVPIRLLARPRRLEDLPRAVEALCEERFEAVP